MYKYRISGEFKKLEYPPVRFEGTVVTATSSSYTESTGLDSQNRYVLALPEGVYTISAQPKCNTFFPPYLTVSVGDFNVAAQEFTVSGWRICDGCYATHYAENIACGDLSLDRDACYFAAKQKLNTCVRSATMQSNSPLYQSTILSVQVHRSSGQPDQQTSTVMVEAEGDYYINISNGDGFNKETSVSSAEISMSGIGAIFAPNDFNKNEYFLTNKVHLTPGSYDLSVILRSQPDSYITILISDRDISTLLELP